MSNPQVKQFVTNIQQKLPTLVTPERCAEQIKQEVRLLMGDLSADIEENINRACEIVKKREKDVEILRVNSIIKRRPDWYRGPKADDLHWPALNGYLRDTQNWDSDAVDSIHETSNEVVSLLANPAEDQFKCRGLVVGYVQSGKTANMTAVIAKAVDAGYNLIVILAGMTNKLRAQTQQRLEKDICGRHRQLWQLYTTTSNEGDFNMPPNAQFTMPGRGAAQLAVIKKVTSRLNAFLRTIRQTQPVILRNLKVLLIDDECDQASVNSANNDYSITAINGAIRSIINELPAVSYIGYTATPFANVFINPYASNGEELDDLYPEDFITALPNPSEYFGPKEVFGDVPENADEDSGEDEGKNMIRIIPGDEVDLIRPRKMAEKETFQPQITDCLVDAILWFIASSAIRRARGHDNKHMTMLVHTSPYIRQHEKMAEAIDAWISENRDGLRSGEGPAFEHLSRVACRELNIVTPQKDAHQIRPDMSDIINHVADVLEALEIVVENSAAADEMRLDYADNPKTYIVVGGAVLARGLTLEGLCVSFFLRTSRQYDTLLQMGRWFGYRTDYEDLPRLWTTLDLASRFSALSVIEQEIREDINLYKKNNITPLEFAVRVRAIPGMAITSASKMRAAYRTEISYEGRHVQTIRFDHKDDEIVRSNWNAGAELVSRIGAVQFAPKKRGLLAVGVEVALIRHFMMSYHICEEHMDLKNELLLGFIDSPAADMPTWNVGIVQLHNGAGPSSGHSLGSLGKVNLLRRSKLQVNDNADYADIKALMSKRDLLIDAESEPSGDSWYDMKGARPGVPLLLLYPIDARSPAKGDSKTRSDLDASGDLLGIGLVFPGEINRSGNYFHVQLEAPTPEQLDEEEVVEDPEEGKGAL